MLLVNVKRPHAELVLHEEKHFNMLIEENETIK